MAWALLALASMQVIATAIVALLLYAQTELMVNPEAAAHTSSGHLRNDQASAASAESGI